MKTKKLSNGYFVSVWQEEGARCRELSKLIGKQPVVVYEDDSVAGAILGQITSPEDAKAVNSYLIKRCDACIAWQPGEGLVLQDLATFDTYRLKDGLTVERYLDGLAVTNSPFSEERVQPLIKRLEAGGRAR